MQPGYEGFARLGELASPAGRHSDGSAYVDQLTKDYGAQREMYARDKTREDARIARARAIAHEGLTPEALQNAGYLKNLAPLLATILGTGESANLGQLGKLQVPEAGGAYADASTAMDQGRLGDYNENIALATGKPYEPLKLVDHQAFNPVTGDASLTPLGDIEAALVRAKTATEGTRATEHAAHAKLYDTQTAAGGYNPNSGKHAKAAGGVDPLAWAHAQIDKGENPKDIADYLIRKGYPDLAKKIYQPGPAALGEIP